MSDAEVSLATPLTRAVLEAECRVSVPLPGSGDTAGRWDALIAWGRRDLPLVKLVEPHHDAVAILSELGGPPVKDGQIWGVWAAEPPFAVLQATRTSSGWRLSGRKAFCSGGTLVTHALVTAETTSGPRLFAAQVDGSDVTVDPSAAPWVAPGMLRAQTETLVFDDVAAEEIGGPGDYTDRPGFWFGAIGIAACWLGGAQGVADQLSATADRLGPHGLAHLGAVRSGTETLSLALEAAANRVDAGMGVEDARRLALVLRANAAALAEDVVSRTGRATGPGPLAFDAQHVQRVADLLMFVRQHHAERDLESLGVWR